MNRIPPLAQFFSCCFLLVLLAGCGLSNGSITGRSWQHEAGYSIGDVITLTPPEAETPGPLVLQRDSILQSGQLVGLVLQAERQLNGGKQVLNILDPVSGTVGRYRLIPQE